eukprot:290359_1
MSYLSTMTASKSLSPPPIEINGMILFASYEQTAAANGWDVSSNEGDGDKAQTEDEEVDNATADGKDEYDFNDDINDEPNEIEQDETALSDDFKGGNDEKNEKSEKNCSDNNDNNILKEIQMDDEHENKAEKDKDKVDIKEAPPYYNKHKKNTPTSYVTNVITEYDAGVELSPQEAANKIKTPNVIDDMNEYNVDYALLKVNAINSNVINNINEYRVGEKLLVISPNEPIERINDDTIAHFIDNASITTLIDNFNLCFLIFKLVIFIICVGNKSSTKQVNNENYISLHTP